ncbi:ribosomal-protein-alanine acetyltransferase [Methanohalobium evestigatum Z-7303]|uniref:Ribosomal-protein-alanine acetyltransferase n=1 Tax=Methanohalobium evestigatum (strain ATCC BAA-1072 / DSM 3721 / NBRC 107634 / OCM 161 / Z-7303) TaxID=644295 RepID=D7E5U4_METEZ|nr:ribosomal protein S18-alanine N-acetyltransferase [Methanohalobium evestigatum]ADI72966.1 ribosomal-protein-alanine acetyltransferase [Methanohalobium evestigatum Z-7303]
MNLRYFEPEDFEDILEIEMETFSEHNPFVYINFYEINSDGFIVATVGDKVAGYVVGYQIYENEGRIFTLAVKKGYRDKGIGSELLRAILNLFCRTGLKYARLEVRRSNVRAQKLYNSMGFVQCWVEKKYYSDGEDGIIMKAYLQPPYDMNSYTNLLDNKINNKYESGITNENTL